MGTPAASLLAVDPAEAWLDLVLLGVSLTVAPSEFGAQMLIAWLRSFETGS